LIRVALGTTARDRALLWLALGAGTVGVVLSGALAAFVAASAAATAAVLVSRVRGQLTARRLAAVAAVVAVTGAGVTALRIANIEAFLRFIGVTPSADTDTFGGESYVQRLALGYIGVRIFLDHPLEGVGWQASSEPWAYEPFLEDTRERYPRLPERLLPGPNRHWGVQNAYIQSAADLGVAGALAFAAALLVPLRRGWRTATRTDADADDEALPLLWLLVAMGIWLGLGIVAGIPTTALQWLAVGLIAGGVARARAR
jgi:O-antigen ligase